METVYLETTFVSYLVALPARDLVIARTNSSRETGGSGAELSSDW